MSNLNNRFLRKSSAPARLVDSSIPVRYYSSRGKDVDKELKEDSLNSMNSIFKAANAASRDNSAKSSAPSKTSVDAADNCTQIKFGYDTELQSPSLSSAVMHINSRAHTHINSNPNTKFSYLRKGSVPARLVHSSVPLGGIQSQDWMICSNSISSQRLGNKDSGDGGSAGVQEIKTYKVSHNRTTENLGETDSGTGSGGVKASPISTFFSKKSLPVVFLHLAIILFVAGSTACWYNYSFFLSLPWISDGTDSDFEDGTIEAKDSLNAVVPPSPSFPKIESSEPNGVLSSKEKEALDLEIEIAWESQHVHELEEILGEKLINNAKLSVHDLERQNRALEDRVQQLMEMEKKLEKEGGNGLSHEERPHHLGESVQHKRSLHHPIENNEKQQATIDNSHPHDSTDSSKLRGKSSLQEDTHNLVRFKPGDIVEIYNSGTLTHEWLPPCKIERRYPSTEDDAIVRYDITRTTDGERISQIPEFVIHAYHPYHPMGAIEHRQQKVDDELHATNESQATDDVKGPSVLCNIGDFGHGKERFVPCSVVSYSFRATRGAMVLQGTYRVRIHGRDGGERIFGGHGPQGGSGENTSRNTFSGREDEKQRVDLGEDAHGILNSEVLMDLPVWKLQRRKLS